MDTELSIEQVYNTLTAALSLSNDVRQAAEQQLRAWETDSAPNFIGSLLKVAAEVQSVPEDSRLLATVVAKNAVGSSWRKVVASREWSRVPEEEKSFVRSIAVNVLLNDPSDRVAVQAGLLVANIARFDVPRPWGTLLPDLMTASALMSPTDMRAKARALATIKQVIRALRTKRFIVDAPTGVSALSSHELTDISRQIDDDRATLFRQEKALLGPLRTEWERNFTGFMAKAPGWEAHAKLAVAGLAAMREVLLVVPDFLDIEEHLGVFMREGVQAATSVAGPLFSDSQHVAVDGDPHKTAMSKCWERLLQCALVVMDEHPMVFAEFLPGWITLCVNTALLGMDANAVHRIRSKSRVLLTRFVARALIQPFYKPEEDRARGLSLAIQMRKQWSMQAALPQLNAASSCLDNLFTEQNGHCAALVMAVVSKYLVLSPEDLAEWEADAEGFARQVDVETSPDADTPRPCGVALLECMLERNGEPVANAIVALAAQLQSQPLAPDNILMREATYHAIGECFSHLRTKVDFKAWYESELRLILQSQELPGLTGDILKARALWLVGVCGEELMPVSWADAYTLAVQHIRSPDPVVSLMAISAVTAMIATVLDEQQFVSRSAEEQKYWLEGMEEINLPAGQDLAAQANAEYNAHVDAINKELDNMINACFTLLPQLGEVESMCRVVGCVSASIELMGDKLQPHLHTITGALPQVWTVISQRSGEGTGALVRLQSSLVALVGHLINRLGAAAMQEQNVAAVMLPLLEHSTNVGNQESEPLLDDGLRLWLAVMKNSTVISPQVQQLFTSRFLPLLRRGKDSAILYKIAEGYLFQGGMPMILPYMTDLGAAFAKSMQAAVDAVRPPAITPAVPQPLAPLPPDVGAEASAAINLVFYIMRIHDSLPVELEPTVRLVAEFMAQHYGGGCMRLPPRSLALMEVGIELMSRLGYKSPHAIHTICAGNVEAENRLLDRWIVLASARDVGELFIPALGAISRTRRHNTAVALCAMLLTDACPGLRDKDRAAQALVVGLKAVRENRLFLKDQQNIRNLQGGSVATTDMDELTKRHIEITSNDPLKSVEVLDAVRAAATHVSSWMGHDQLIEAVSNIETMLGEQLKAVMQGQLPEEQEQAALEAFHDVALNKE